MAEIEHKTEKEILSVKDLDCRTDVSVDEAPGWMWRREIYGTATRRTIVGTTMMLMVMEGEREGGEAIRGNRASDTVNWNSPSDLASVLHPTSTLAARSCQLETATTISRAIFYVVDVAAKSPVPL